VGGIAAISGESLLTGITSARATLGAGDLLEIGVFDVPELTQRVRVDGEGKIALPLIGQLSVSGNSADSVRALVRQRLIAGHFVRDPQVSLFVIEYAGQMVYISGEVNRPGAYSLLRNYRLMDLVAVAGGMTARSGNLITLTREGDPGHPIRIHLNDRGEAEDNPTISPGDSVLVGPAGVVYVLGGVTRPGGFILDRRTKMTVLEALALAEGPTQVASLHNATLIHSTDPNPQPIPIDIKMIVKTEKPDLVLQGGDIIWVADSQTRNLGRLAISTILATAGGVAVYAAYPR
jgi:polysaccharide export outer membrane protein